MTRRCSVMRMPVAAQRASIPPEGLIAEGDFSAVIGNSLEGRRSAIQGMLRQVAAHQKRIQLFPACLPVVTFAAPDDGKSGPLVEPPRWLVILFDLKEDGSHPPAGQMAEMCQQEVAGETASAIAGVDGDGQNLGLVRRHPGYGEADRLSSEPETMQQRVAFCQHALELGFAPAAMKRRAMKLREPRRIADFRGFDHSLAAAPEFGEPRHHEVAGRAG